METEAEILKEDLGGGGIRSEGIQQPKTEGEGLRKSHAGKHQPGKNSGIQFSGNEEEMRADDKRKLQGGGHFFDADLQKTGWD